MVNFSRSLSKLSRSPGLFFFPFPPTFPSPSCYNWNLPESGGHYRPYSLLKRWLFTSPTPYVHRILIQVRTLPSSLLSFADHFPLFSSGKEKKNTQFLWSIQNFRLCRLLSLPIAVLCTSSEPHQHLLPGWCWPLPHRLSLLHNPCLILGSINIRRGHWSHFQWSCPLSDFSHLLPGSDSGPCYDQ